MRTIQTEPFADIFGRRGPQKPQPIPHLPTPRYCRVSVFAAAGGLADITKGTLRFDDPSWPILEATKEGGRLKFALPKLAVYGWQVHLKASTADQEGAWSVVLAPDIDVALKPPAPLLKPLGVSGQFFGTDDGPFTVIGCSDFALWQRFSRHEDITPVLRQRRDLGFNTLRVFTRYRGGLGDFDGSQVAQTLRPFCDLVGQHGLRLELVVSADSPAFGWSVQQELAWWNTVNQLVAGLPHVSLEGINEGDHPANQTDAVAQFANPSVLASRGSAVQDGGTMLPVMHYATYHPARGGEDWPRRIGHNAMEDVGEPQDVPTVSNECKRPDEDGYHADRFFDAGANGALMCAGSVYHCTQGKASVPFTGGDLACAIQWVAGAKAVPLEFQRGHYSAGHLHDSPLDGDGASRVHAKILGNRACAVVTGREPGYTPKPKNGWTVTKVNHQSVIELTR